MDSQTVEIIESYNRFELLEDTESFTKIRRHTTPVMPVSGCKRLIRAVKRKPLRRNVARRHSGGSNGFRFQKSRRKFG